MNEKPRILVTGANGQLGKELKNLSLSYPQFQFFFLSRNDLPIHHFALLRNYFATLKPDYCINGAAYTDVDRAEVEKDQAFLVNAEAVGVLAAVCKEHHTKLLLISTDYVFDGKTTTPYSEEAIPHPLNVYGASKWEGEKQALLLNPEVIILRTSWLFSVYGKNFVKTIFRLLKEKNEIRVVNDQTGSPTYAADLAETLLKIITTGHTNSTNWKPGIYHFCNEGAVSWYQFALAIKELTGSKAMIHPISSMDYPAAAQRPAYSVLDTTKIRQVYPIPIKNWKVSLQACISQLQRLSQ